jgi:drug/metabolite transporter superfamily protein YnfA
MNENFSKVNSTTVESRSSQSKIAGEVILGLFLFVLAGIAEIGGGFLIWKGIREKYKPSIVIPFGALVLIIYGFIPTLQPQGSFGRIFAVYGGFFIVLSYIWGYLFDGLIVDKGDLIGSGISLAGVCICWFWPR